MDIICKISSDYKSYVTRYKRGSKQLLVSFQNTLYGKMVASLLYYRKFTKSLTSIGYDTNPYYPYVANKVINGSQMIICFHVDDCKLIHSERKSDNIIIKWLCQ